jgi:hypothetical protein
MELAAFMQKLDISLRSIALTAMILISPILVKNALAATTSSDETPFVNYLVYGTAGEPLQMVDANGDVSGFITEVVNEIFSDSGIAVIPIIKPITRQKPEMINGEATRWIAYALNSWKKEGVWANATFSDIDLIPYTLSLGYKKVEGLEEISQLSKSLTQGGVVWIRGFKYPGTKAFSERYGFEFDRAKNHAAMLKMVDAGYVKFFMEHAPRMRYIMKKENINEEEFLFYSLQDEVPPTAITLLMSNDLGIDTIAMVNRRLKAMFAAGRIAELTRAYGL